MTPSEYRRAARRLYADTVIARGDVGTEAALLVWIAEGRTWHAALGLSLSLAGAMATAHTLRSRAPFFALASTVIAGEP